MSTLEQLEAEAAELYPNPPGCMFNGKPFPRFEQEAHVRAKTISAEQLEKAAEVVFEGGTGGQWEEVPHWGREPYVEVTRAAFRAAGFYVEEPA